MREKQQHGKPEAIEGSVERVTFHSEESGFCVLRVRVKGVREPVAVVGTLPNIVPGEWIKARGVWVNDRKHGLQFKADELATAPPDSIEGIEKFLGSGLIKGIGPVYAAKLVERFGKNVFDVIETQSAMLETVEGIGRVRRMRIKDSWTQTRSIRSIMAFLLSHGVGTARAFRIHKAYGDDAIQRIRDDPYCLARDIRGIGFKSADQVAEKLHVPKDSPLRARAGVEYVLLELTQEGHCAYPRAGLVEKARSILEVDPALIEDAIDHGIEAKRLVHDRSDPESLIYLSALYHAECDLAHRLCSLGAGPHPCPPIDIDRAIDWSQSKMGIEFAAAQKDAVRAAAASKVTIITGGPGVGKTTILRAVLSILAAKKLKVSLCAPTGRAAKRMAEATGRYAKTIHRLLAFDPKQGAFRHNENAPLDGDVFVADECSMLDLPLAHALVRAIPPHAALILVGDVDQLPSVGPGTVLRDIIDSQSLAVCRLTHVFRQAAASSIVTNAHAINQGHMPALKSERPDNDFFFFRAEEPEEAAAQIVRLVSTSIPKKFGLDPVQDIQVLAPMHRGVLGAQNLNRLLQDALNPNGESVQRFGVTFRSGDKVMQLENDYDKDVFNGDIGVIRKVDSVENELIVEFDGRRVSYDYQELDELVPSYAISIHKSQGSEYPCVIVPVHTQHYIMLQRNLIYTAVTRGRRLVVLVGTEKAIAIAVKRVGSDPRVTPLDQRLRARLARTSSAQRLS